MLYDVSPPLSPRLAVWPGDPPLTREVITDMGRGDPVTLSALRATCHLGAHADAPSHYGRDGRTIDAQPLDLYLGPCQVMRVSAARGGEITPDLLPTPVTGPRVLLGTGTYPDPHRFNEDYAALHPDLLGFLHGKGVRLVGVDTPSVDRLDAADLPAHRACLRHDVAILEGLLLSAVPEGVYELIALPLRLVGFDASPVRAVLRPLA